MVTGVREMDRFLEQWEMGVKDVHRRLILAPTPRERERWHAVWLLAQGWTASATAEALERDPHTIGRWATAFGEGGPAALVFEQTGGSPPRTIAKSGSSSVEPGDGLRWAEGAAFGSQGHGHLGRKPSLEAQGIQCRVDQGGECLTQTGSAQGVNVLIPAAVLHMMLAVLNAPVVAEQLEQPSGPTLT